MDDEWNAEVDDGMDRRSLNFNCNHFANYGNNILIVGRDKFCGM